MGGGGGGQRHLSSPTLPAAQVHELRASPAAAGPRRDEDALPGGGAVSCRREGGPVPAVREQGFRAAHEAQVSASSDAAGS